LWLGAGLLVRAAGRREVSSELASEAGGEAPLGWLMRGLVTNLLNAETQVG
jgi:hypothetical protein